VIAHQTTGSIADPISVRGKVFARGSSGAHTYAVLNVLLGNRNMLDLYVDDPDQLLALAEESTALAHKLQKQLAADRAADAVMNADDAREMAEATL
jgi:hypothetical protein